MAKQFFQDIIPPDKRSIKKIPLPVRKSGPSERNFERLQQPQQFQQSQPTQQKIPRSIPLSRQHPIIQENEHDSEYDSGQENLPRPVRMQKNRGGRIIVIVITLVILAALCTLALYLMFRFTGARIVITPQIQTLAVDAQMTAQQSGDGVLHFQTVTIARDGKMTVTAQGEETVSTKASGIIVVYNGYTKAPQKLVANTRFESPQGLIFRITQSIVIPGMHIYAGKVVPGSVEVAVTADAAGADYNVGLTDFSIPGFKNDPKYTKFYGRSKIPIQGGFSGTRKKVADAELISSRNKIRSEVKNDLLIEAEKDIPTGFVMPANGYYIEYESLADTEVINGVQLAERATFHGIIFNKTELAQEIAKRANGPVSSPGVVNFDILDAHHLNFTMKNTGSIRPWEDQVINFSLQGSISLVPNIDTDKLLSELAGKPRKSLTAILANYPSITKADVSIKPFWKSSFPESREEITLIISSTTANH